MILGDFTWNLYQVLEKKKTFLGIIRQPAESKKEHWDVDVLKGGVRMEGTGGLPMDQPDSLHNLIRSAEGLASEPFLLPPPATSLLLYLLINNVFKPSQHFILVYLNNWHQTLKNCFSTMTMWIRKKLRDWRRNSGSKWGLSILANVSWLYISQILSFIICVSKISGKTIYRLWNKHWFWHNSLLGSSDLF